MSDMGGCSAQEIYARIVELTPERSLVIGVGNIGGVGGELMTLVRSKSAAA
jgi:hypothetical protein